MFAIHQLLLITFSQQFKLFTFYLSTNYFNCSFPLAHYFNCLSVFFIFYLIRQFMLYIELTVVANLFACLLVVAHTFSILNLIENNYLD